MKRAADDTAERILVKCILKNLKNLPGAQKVGSVSEGRILSGEGDAPAVDDGDEKWNGN